MTLEEVARRVGSHKGYISGIEKGRVNPPSVKLIARFAKLMGANLRRLVLLAWVDKAPALIRKDAILFLDWVDARERSSPLQAESEPPPSHHPPPTPGGPPHTA